MSEDGPKATRESGADSNATAGSSVSNHMDANTELTDLGDIVSSLNFEHPLEAQGVIQNDVVLATDHTGTSVMSMDDFQSIMRSMEEYVGKREVQLLREHEVVKAELAKTTATLSALKQTHSDFSVAFADLQKNSYLREQRIFELESKYDNDSHLTLLYSQAQDIVNVIKEHCSSVSVKKGGIFPNFKQPPLVSCSSESSTLLFQIDQQFDAMKHYLECLKQLSLSQPREYDSGSINDSLCISQHEVLSLSDHTVIEPQTSGDSLLNLNPYNVPAATWNGQLDYYSTCIHGVKTMLDQIAEQAAEIKCLKSKLRHQKKKNNQNAFNRESLMICFNELSKRYQALETEHTELRRHYVDQLDQSTRICAALEKVMKRIGEKILGSTNTVA